MQTQRLFTSLSDSTRKTKTMTSIEQPLRLLRDEPNHPYGIGYFEKVIGVDDEKGFFSFNPAQPITSSRCDEGWWGPMSFHVVTDGACSCGNIDQNDGMVEVCQSGVVSVDTVIFSCPFMSMPPIGFICYQELKDTLAEDQLCVSHWNGNARTLQELLRLMWEWHNCHTVLGDDSLIATIASQLWVGMNPPQDVVQWVDEVMPEGAVYRFLAGDPDARVRQSNIPQLSDEASHWLLTLVIDKPMSYGLTGSTIKA